MAAAYPGCRTVIRQALETRGVPAAALDVCMASITTSTLRQYNVGLKLWWFFCDARKRSCFAASIPEVIEFLQEEFDRGASYGTLNSHRSAISLILGPEMAQDTRISRFFKGIFQLRPSRPKYMNTWDPAVVLTYLRTLDNNNISLQLLSYKLAVLLALASGQRVQTLSLIELKNIQCLDHGVNIFIEQRIKSSGPNKLQPVICLPIFTADRDICVASTLLLYIQKTKPLRATGVGNELLITFKKPHHNASSQSISRWIRKVMQNAGIDTSQFGSHSTRHASTSSVDKKGVSMDIIRSAAGWSNNSKTFAIFYKRPIHNAYSFAEAVLSS